MASFIRISTSASEVSEESIIEPRYLNSFVKSNFEKVDYGHENGIDGGLLLPETAGFDFGMSDAQSTKSSTAYAASGTCWGSTS